MQKTQLLLLLLAVFAPLQSSAQPVEFAPVGAQWTYSNYQIYTPPISETPHVVTVEAKELYQGKLCSKLVNTGSITTPDPLYLYQQNDSVFFFSDTTHQFQMLYDFGAGIGESWTIYGLVTSYGYDSLVVTVDDIWTRNVSGVDLKVQSITFPLHPFEWNFEIVEGVGNLFFLAPHFAVPDNTPHNLRCYSDAQYDLHFVEFACDTTFTISDREPVLAQISLSPNPATDFVTIRLPENMGYFENLTVEVYDAFGKMQLQTVLSGNATTFSIADLPSGLYQVVVRDGYAVVGTGKVAVVR